MRERLKYQKNKDAINGRPHTTLFWLNRAVMLELRSLGSIYPVQIIRTEGLHHNSHSLDWLWLSQANSYRVIHFSQKKFYRVSNKISSSLFCSNFKEFELITTCWRANFDFSRINEAGLFLLGLTKPNILDIFFTEPIIYFLFLFGVHKFPMALPNYIYSLTFLCGGGLSKNWPS